MSNGIEVDLSEARKSAELVRDMVEKLRAAHVLAPFEYTKDIRIAPGEVPHSHPTLTINTMIQAEAPLLCIYLHEQMHWYVTWYSHANREGWRGIWRELKRMFPSVPVAFPLGAHTEASSYLHIIINWLEIDAAATLLGRTSAIEIASKNFVYSGIYALVLGEWERLSKLYAEHGLVPIRAATEMSSDDLLLAAKQDEADVN